ncbi:conserved hypothetical protein [Afipia carboxidovorans OM5]|uniref:Transmembrane protein n=1 Tax=Afipia carboxidovorans (strain ATCC 49405 / DSM 1227 / KCTC 32145 / OM5) TaxID=504832 RepID=B6JEH0_AFIC5|nr:hypothetical protein [Afipia carboxidovorans]ACI92735.1 conserved hypothetical protein [Afipia carboxidovorans OM5]AEI03513.1 hypothetical protein OCA4_c23930 [Afipia carboxidovorans OM4]AEI07090.1 hypothetical protein OCA5_c23940 [Afipia carboxidovorans OM5]BEV44665.1 hypothetical protein CRBSH125_08480 [Afipia carboxidovorans]
MDAVAKQAFEALGPFIIVQFAVAAAVFYGIWTAATRGVRDSRTEAVPQWLLIAPAHDAIEDLSEISEHMRRQTKLLEKIEASLTACKVALELIRDESRLR